MEKIDKELLDHMVGKTPVTQAMADAIKQAARDSMVTQRHIVRWALRDWLKQGGWL